MDPDNKLGGSGGGVPEQRHPTVQAVAEILGHLSFAGVVLVLWTAVVCVALGFSSEKVVCDKWVYLYWTWIAAVGFALGVWSLSTFAVWRKRRIYPTATPQKGTPPNAAAPQVQVPDAGQPPAAT